MRVWVGGGLVGLALIFWKQTAIARATVLATVRATVRAMVRQRITESVIGSSARLQAMVVHLLFFNTLLNISQLSGQSQYVRQDKYTCTTSQQALRRN